MRPSFRRNKPRLDESSRTAALALALLAAKAIDIGLHLLTIFSLVAENAGPPEAVAEIRSNPPDRGQNIGHRRLE
jgi:hypothetical protein